MKAIQKHGVTLFELLIAITISGILIASLTSVILLSSKTLNLHNSAAAKSSRSASILSKVQSDLQLALEFSVKDPNHVAFSVPDRNGDGIEEQIEYIWNSSDLKLSKSVKLSIADNSTIQVIARDVDSFDLSYVARSVGDPVGVTLTESDPILMHVNDDKPEGDGIRVLMIVNNPTWPTSDEETRKTELENWGFLVTLAGQDDPPADLSNQDAVYVAAPANWFFWNALLRDSSIGLVVEPKSLIRDLGFGEIGEGASNRTRISSDFLTHYVMQGWVEGATEIFDAPHNIQGVSTDLNNRSESLSALATINSGPCIALLEPGDAPYVSSGVSTVNLGNTDPFEEEVDSKEVAQTMFAFPVTVTNPGEFTEVLTFVDIAAGEAKLRFGIYTDNNGAPDQMVTESPSVGLFGPQQNVWIGSQVPAVTIQPGVYWLTVSVEDNVTLHVNSNALANTFEMISPSVQSGLQQAWVTSDSKQRDLTIYGKYQEQPSVKNRRVLLPWDVWDFVDLNSDAVSLLRRSLEWAADTTPTDASKMLGVNTNNDPFYYFEPDRIPVNATSWAPTRIHIAVRRNPSNTSGKIKFALHVADGSQEPGELLDETEWIPVGQVSHDDVIWYEIPFQKVDWQDPSIGLCLVVKGESNAKWDAIFPFDSAASGDGSGTATGTASETNSVEPETEADPLAMGAAVTGAEPESAESVDTGAAVAPAPTEEAGTTEQTEAVAEEAVEATSIEWGSSGKLRIYVFGRYQKNGSL